MILIRKGTSQQITLSAHKGVHAKYIVPMYVIGAGQNWWMLQFRWGGALAEPFTKKSLKVIHNQANYNFSVWTSSLRVGGGDNPPFPALAFKLVSPYMHTYIYVYVLRYLSLHSSEGAAD